MRARTPDQEGSVVRDGVKIAYEVFGSGETTILLMPSWSIIHSRFWKMQVPYLARHYRVVTFDGRGNGKSDRPAESSAYTKEEYVADALAVLDATNTPRAALVTLSMSAQWGLLLAADYPERVAGVVFIAPSLPIPPFHASRALSSFDDVLPTDKDWAKYNRHYWLRDYQGFLEFFFSQCFVEPHSTKQVEDSVGWGLETTPDLSPALPGPYQTSRVILGEAGFPALQLDKNQFPDAPSKILAAVYFPTDTVIPSPTRFNGALQLAKGPYQFPLILYGHALRTAIEPSAGHDPKRDFTTVGAMLGHLASYGCVCIAPDLSWIGGDATKANWQREAVVFLKYYQLLVATLDQQVFNNQLRLGNVVMIGHSHRAGSVVNAGRGLPLFGGPKPLAYGLIAPEVGGDTEIDINNVLVIGGTLDTLQAAAPQRAFAGSATPKTLVEIPGANHFGYTDLVSPDNVAVCNCADGQINLNDNNGAISRDAQQQTAAAFLAAMVRYYALYEGPMRGYLSGERQVEGLTVSGIQVQAQGIPFSPPTMTPARPTLALNK